MVSYRRGGIKTHRPGRTNSRVLLRHTGPLRDRSKTLEIHCFSAMRRLGARSELVRAGQNSPKTFKNVGKTKDPSMLGPWGPRRAPGGFTWRPVDFAGGNAKTLGKTMVFCWRASVSRRLRPLQVRAGQSRSELTKNLQNHWKNKQFHPCPTY